MTKSVLLKHDRRHLKRRNSKYCGFRGVYFSFNASIVLFSIGFLVFSIWFFSFNILTNDSKLFPKNKIFQTSSNRITQEFTATNELAKSLQTENDKLKNQISTYLENLKTALTISEKKQRELDSNITS